MKKLFVITGLLCATSTAFAQDDYFQFAQKAYENKDYELCLISLPGSPLASQPQGLELERLCRAGDTSAATLSTAPSAVAPTALESEKPYSLFTKGRVGRSDNINQVASPVEKSNYAIGVGGEYVFKKVIEFGLGVSYDHFDIVDTDDSTGTVSSVFAPLGYASGPHQISANVFYNTNTTDNVTTFNESGLSLGYYFRFNDYMFNLVNNYSERKHKDEVQAYQTGVYNSLQLNVIRNLDKWALGLGYNADRNDSGDMPFGTMRILPMRHLAQGATLTVAYNLSDRSKLTARYKRADLDFKNIGGNLATKRKDTIQSTSLTYLHIFTAMVSAYVQQTYTDNESTFDKTELLNKNYSENLTSVGFTVYSN